MPSLAKSLCRIWANAVNSALLFCMITSPVTGRDARRLEHRAGLVEIERSRR